MFAKGKETNNNNNKEKLNVRAPQERFFRIVFQIKKCVTYLTAAITMSASWLLHRFFFFSSVHEFNSRRFARCPRFRHFFRERFLIRIHFLWPVFFSLSIVSICSVVNTFYRYIIQCDGCVSHLFIDRKRNAFYMHNTNGIYFQFRFSCSHVDYQMFCTYPPIFHWIVIKNVPFLCVCGFFLACGVFSRFLSNIHKIIN